MNIKRLRKFFPSKGFKVIKMILTIILSIILTLIIAFIAFYVWGSSPTLPVEKYSEIIRYSSRDTLSSTHSSKKNETNETNETNDKTNEFTLMTYNIGYLSGMSNNRPVRVEKQTFETHMDQFLHLVKQIEPDFIGFQEIDFHSHRSYNIDQLKHIADNSGYPFGAKAINWDKHYVPFPSGPISAHFKAMLSGQAVLSRFPIISTERIVFQKPEENPFYYNAFYMDRIAQIVNVRLNDQDAGQGIEQDIILINVHLEAFHQKTREKQAEAVMNIFRTYDKDYPVLLFGDFNSVPPEAPGKTNFSDEPETDFTSDRTISILMGKPLTGNKDNNNNSPSRDPLHQNSKSPIIEAADMSIFTFPSQTPNRKLDYVFYNPIKIECVTVFAPQISSSDHHPLVVKFRLKKTKTGSPIHRENKEK